MQFNIFRMRQQLNRSYKEVCAPMLEKCRFLLYEVRPAISLEQLGLQKLFLLYKSPRFKSCIQKLIKEKKISKKQLECEKLEDIVLSSSNQQSNIASIKVQQIVHESLEKYLSNENLSKAGSIEAINTRASSPSVEMLEVKQLSIENLLDIGSGNTVTEEEKKWNEDGADEIKTPVNLPMDLKLKSIDMNEQFINNVIAKLSEKCVVENCDKKYSINSQVS